VSGDYSTPLVMQKQVGRCLRRFWFHIFVICYIEVCLNRIVVNRLCHIITLHQSTADRESMRIDAFAAQLC